MPNISNNPETQEIYDICHMFGHSLPTDKQNELLTNLDFTRLSTGGIMSAIRSTYSDKARGISCWLQRFNDAYKVVKDRGEDPEKIFRGLTHYIDDDVKIWTIQQTFRTLLDVKLYDSVVLILDSLDWWRLSPGQIKMAIETVHPHKQHISNWNSRLNIAIRALNELGLDGAKILIDYTNRVD